MDDFTWRFHLLIWGAFLCLAVAQYAGGETSQRQGEGETSSQKPNIVFIMADDMGHADAPWNHRSIPTRLRHAYAPTLTRLAESGIIFDQGYTVAKCTPSRAAFMTGRYPYRYGLHKTNVLPESDFGLKQSETLVPAVLKRLGYRTHLLGKWHLGHCNVNMTPTARGYDTFFGALVGSFDYFQHVKTLGAGKTGYVMHNGTRPTFRHWGQYATNLFGRLAGEVIDEHVASPEHSEKPLFLTVFFNAPHTPTQPGSYSRHFNESNSFYGGWRRKGHLGLIYGLDTAVGDIVDKLMETGLWNNTLLIFASDNGGFPGQGLNYPLRSGKSKDFEGGSRVPMFAYHPSWHTESGYRSQALVHMVDWLPTLATVAGGRREDIPRRLDGIDFSQILMSPTDLRTTRRVRMVYNAVNVRPGGQTRTLSYGAYRERYWKVIATLNQKRSDWYISRDGEGPPNGGSREAADLVRFPSSQYWGLFNLLRDPNEENNLLKRYPTLFSMIRNRLYQHLHTAVRPMTETHRREVETSLPAANRGFWTHGWC